MSTPGGARRADALAQIAQDKLQPLWISCDRHWRVVEQFGAPATFGYAAVATGEDVRETLHFVHGLEPDAALELEFVETPNGRCVHAQFRPREDGVEVLLLDATSERDQRQVLQQKSNEVSLLLDELGRLNGTLERKNEEAIRLNQLQARFIANMSHEFRTPLSSIVAYARFLREGDSRITLATGLENIDRAAQHLLTLIANLIDQAQFEVGEIELRPAATSLAALFEDLIALFQPMATAKGLGFNVTLPVGGPDTIEIDETRWRQVLVNLLGNAFKYTESGDVDFSAAWRGDALEMLIGDTGCGIAADALESIFEPFHREAGSPVQGSGLGLSITQRLVELMSGTIAVDSEPGAGTSITLRLPAPAARDASGSGSAHRSPGTVLVVEDDSDVYDVLEIYLDDAGYAVFNSSTAATALVACNDVAPGAIVLDLNMPDMSGIELTTLLRKTGFSGPIIMLTASSLGSDRARALAAGCDEYLVKPVAPERLVAVLTRLTNPAPAATKPPA